MGLKNVRMFVLPWMVQFPDVQSSERAAHVLHPLAFLGAMLDQCPGVLWELVMNGTMDYRDSCGNDWITSIARYDLT